MPIAPQSIEGYDAPVAVSVLDHAKLDGRLAAGTDLAEPPVMPAPGSGLRPARGQAKAGIQ